MEEVQGEPRAAAAAVVGGGVAPCPVHVQYRARVFSCPLGAALLFYLSRWRQGTNVDRCERKVLVPPDVVPSRRPRITSPTRVALGLPFVYAHALVDPHRRRFLRTETEMATWCGRHPQVLVRRAPSRKKLGGFFIFSYFFAFPQPREREARIPSGRPAHLMPKQAAPAALPEPGALVLVRLYDAEWPAQVRGEGPPAHASPTSSCHQYLSFRTLKPCPPNPLRPKPLPPHPTPHTPHPTPYALHAMPHTLHV